MAEPKETTHIRDIIYNNNETRLTRADHIIGLIQDPMTPEFLLIHSTYFVDVFTVKFFPERLDKLLSLSKGDKTQVIKQLVKNTKKYPRFQEITDYCRKLLAS